MSNRSRCSAVRIFNIAGEPSAGFTRMRSLSLWHRANFQCRSRKLCGFRKRRIALAATPREFQRHPRNPLRVLCVARSTLVVAPCEFSTWTANPIAVFNKCPRWRVERLANSVWNCQRSRCVSHVATWWRGAFCSNDEWTLAVQ